MFMGSNSISLLNNLTNHKDDCTIKVRILHKWINHVWEEPDRIISMDMILIDEKGNKAHCSLLKKWLYKFEKLLVVNRCLLINYASIGLYNQKYKYVDNPHKVNLYFKSSVKQCDDFGGDLNGFNFTSLDLLCNNSVPSETIVDVIGVITSYCEIEDVTKANGKQAKKMELELKDIKGETITITLWGSYAEQMSTYLLKNLDEACVVIILQYGLFKMFYGNAYVSNSLNVTKLLINADIEEIISFKTSLVDLTADESSSSSRLTAPSVRVRLHEEFLFKTDFSHIVELDEIVAPKHVIICGTIQMMSKHMKWYYLACKICTKQVKDKVSNNHTLNGSKENEIKKQYICESEQCKQAMVEAIPRYKIYLEVQDSTGNVSLNLWETEALKLLNISAADLLDKVLNGEYDDSYLFPKEVKNLENMKYAFKIKINQYNLDNPGNTYSISKLTDDAIIIAKLQKKHNLVQHDDPDSRNVMSVDASEDSVTLKDVVSATDENSTPLEKSTGRSLSGNQNIASIKSSKADLKRNLVDVYDVEDPPAHSATKARTNSIVTDKSSGKEPLLIPKLEK